ncbi:MAG: SulP family inorganic anion transporter [Myxococcota bacterium]
MLRQPIDAARGYTLEKLRSDLVAGLTVAVVSVPSAMAYALIAGVPAEYGLYTLIVQCLIGSLLNSQPFLSVGPVNTHALLVAAVATRAMTQLGELGPAEYGARYLELVVLLTLLKGVLQLGLATIGLGAAVRFVSQSVIVGFVAGAGILIAVGQIPGFLGIAAVRSASDWPGLVGAVQRAAPHLADTSGPSVAVGLVCLALLLLGRRLPSRFPSALVAVVVGAGAVVVAGWSASDLLLVRPLPEGLPGFRLPVMSWTLAEALLGGALALSLLGLLESFSIGKTIARQTGQRINPNQELLSQGVTNAISSFFQCIPGSGSFARSALNFQAGAATLYAGVFNSVFVAAILLLFSPLARLIPMASLAAILFVIAYELVDWRAIVRMARASRPDMFVCLATLGATLFIPLAYAVFVGILLNVSLYLQRSSRLQLVEMVPAPDGSFAERPLGTEAGPKLVVFLQLEGNLFFGVADELQDQLSLGSAGARAVVLRLKRTLSVDSTVLSVLDQFIRDMQGRGASVLLCGVRPELALRLRRYGLVDLLGEEGLFESEPGIFVSARRALARAHRLARAAASERSETARGADAYEI